MEIHNIDNIDDMETVKKVQKFKKVVFFYPTRILDPDLLVICAIHKK